eukprot:TRINITY_DN18373_c0_g2_i1.p1 TRINITY_DN18373_c0_g2~~TRINITY_DN18373_c0_g2_i1.p1  ORF type:complete len:607 (-),score=170.07 TRINITY_DN18373_c0_g2_i1:231-2051(-)
MGPHEEQEGGSRSDDTERLLQGLADMLEKATERTECLTKPLQARSWQWLGGGGGTAASSPGAAQKAGDESEEPGARYLAMLNDLGVTPLSPTKKPTPVHANRRLPVARPEAQAAGGGDGGGGVQASRPAEPWALRPWERLAQVNRQRSQPLHTAQLQADSSPSAAGTTIISSSPHKSIMQRHPLVSPQLSSRELRPRPVFPRSAEEGASPSSPSRQEAALPTVREVSDRACQPVLPRPASKLAEEQVPPGVHVRTAADSHPLVSPQGGYREVRLGSSVERKIDFSNSPPQARARKGSSSPGESWLQLQELRQGKRQAEEQLQRLRELLLHQEQKEARSQSQMRMQEYNHQQLLKQVDELHRQTEDERARAERYAAEAATLRQEQQDQKQREAMLEGEAARLREEVTRLRSELTAARLQNEELEQLHTSRSTWAQEANRLRVEHVNEVQALQSTLEAERCKTTRLQQELNRNQRLQQLGFKVCLMCSSGASSRSSFSFQSPVANAARQHRSFFRQSASDAAPPPSLFRHASADCFDVPGASLHSEEALAKHMAAMELQAFAGIRDEEERGQLKKRLQMKWHPDKNGHNSSFATRVLQEMQRMPAWQN